MRICLLILTAPLNTMQFAGLLGFEGMNHTSRLRV